MNIKVEVNPPPPLDIRSLAGLFGRCGWGREEDYSEDYIKWWPKGSDNIIVVVALNEENRLLGYARALTDHYTVTWLAEILVDPDYRNQKIGTRLINEVVKRTRHTAFYTNIFTSTEGFFEKFNLTPKPKLVAVSRKPIPPSSS